MCPLNQQHSDCVGSGRRNEPAAPYCVRRCSQRRVDVACTVAFHNLIRAKSTVCTAVHQERKLTCTTDAWARQARPGLKRLGLIQPTLSKQTGDHTQRYRIQASRWAVVAEHDLRRKSLTSYQPLSLSSLFWAEFQTETPERIDGTVRCCLLLERDTNLKTKFNLSFGFRPNPKRKRTGRRIQTMHNRHYNGWFDSNTALHRNGGRGCARISGV